MKRILGALSLILVVSVLIIGCGGNKTSTPKDAVNEYYSLMKSGKMEKAMALTTMTDEEIKKEIAKYEGFKLEIKNYEIVSEQIAEDGQSAKVKVKFSFTSSMTDKVEEQTSTVKLNLIEGVWKIKD